MDREPKWIEIPRFCRHCGGALEARPKWNSGSQISGCEVMEYRHSMTGKQECWERHEAGPYSNWGAYAEWGEALSVSQE